MTIDIYRLHKYKGDGVTKAFVDLIVDDVLILKGFKLIEGRSGLFLGLPREKGKDDKYFDTVRFNNVDAQKEIERKVIERYHEIKE